MIELFVFDWSGTISNDARPVYESNIRILEKYGKKKFSFEEWRSKSTASVVEIMQNEGIEEEPEIIRKLYHKFLNMVIEEGIRPFIYPDAKDVLGFLNSDGRILTVLSTHPRENLVREAESYDVAGFFDLIQGEAKDKAPALEEMCAKFGIQQSATLFTGDTIYDIRAAKKARVVSAAVCTGYHTRERLEKENPCYVFENLADLSSVNLHQLP